MGLFSKKQSVPTEPALTLDEQSENMKAVAIEYITSLTKADKERFFEGAELIWQGYNNSIDKVLTRHQRALRRSNGQAQAEDDDISTFLLEDEPTSKPSIAAPTPPAPVDDDLLDDLANDTSDATTTPKTAPKKGEENQQ